VTGVGGGRALLRAYVSLIYAFLFFPIVVVVLLSFTENITILDLSRLTTRWYRQLWDSGQILRALLFSVEIGLTCAALATVLGALAAFAMVRHSFRGKPLIQAALFSPMVLPEIITAVALLSFFSLLKVPRGYPTLIIGHTLLILPYVISITSARLYGFNRAVEEAALNLGATPLRTLAEITLPLIAPALVGAALIAFKVSFDNVVGSLFWSPLGNQPLPVLVFAMLRFELTPMINAIGTLIVVVSLCCISAYQLLQLSRGVAPEAAR
jgi:spermidine/putrescine transport system permease protein